MSSREQFIKICQVELVVCGCWGRLCSAFLVFLLLASPLILPAPVFSQQGPIPSTFSAPNHQIEDLAAHFYNDNALLVVSGTVRNFSFQSLRGSVIVYLKNQGDEVLVAFEHPVNNGAAISYGMAGGFEVSANISSYSQASNVSVEFVPSRPPVTAKSP